MCTGLANGHAEPEQQPAMAKRKRRGDDDGAAERDAQDRVPAGKRNQTSFGLPAITQEASFSLSAPPANSTDAAAAGSEPGKGAALCHAEGCLL